MHITKTTARFWLFSLCLFASITAITAQTPTPLPYFCGFEDDAENALWTLNPYRRQSDYDLIKNRWYINQGSANMGLKSLFISCDTARTNGYDNQTSTLAIHAYREFYLPAGGNGYELSFQYRWLADTDCDLKVYYIPVEPANAFPVFALPSGTLPNWAMQQTNEIKNESNVLNQSGRWETFTGRISGKNVACRLVFLWSNKASTKTPQPPAISIDNIQIVKTPPTQYKAPTLLKATMDRNAVGMLNINVTWQGQAGRYQLQYVNSTDKLNPEPTRVDNIAENKYTIYNVPTGVYDVWVRSTGEQDTSRWVLAEPVLVYDVNDYCIDYLNLDRNSQNQTLCQTMDMHGNSGNNNERIIDRTADGKVDNGYKDLGSKNDPTRHTVHFLPGEKDPNTGYQLSTVPDGEIASVRIGNRYVTMSNTRSQGEAVTYTFTPTGEATILLIKYAVVLQNPQHLDAHNNCEPLNEHRTAAPQFLLDILNEDGKPLGDCYSIDFSAGNWGDDGNWQEQGWNLYYPGTINTGTAPCPRPDEIYWKDWTTMGIALDGLTPGEPIQIRFQSFDCSIGGHFGYGFFTINCLPAEITGVSCSGVDNGVSAPIGFDYTWTAPDGSIVPDSELSADKRTFYPAKDDLRTYTCTLHSKEKPSSDCDIDLQVDLRPNLPRARFTPVVKSVDCQNTLQITNDSYIEIGGEVSSGKPKRYEWDFGGGVYTDDQGQEQGTYTSNEHKDPPVVKYPQAGGAYTVKMRAIMADGQCYEDTSVTVNVPNIGDRDTTIIGEACPDGFFWCVDRWHKPGQDTIYNLKSPAGCDSVIHLQVIEMQVDTIRRDTVITSFQLPYLADPNYPDDILNQGWNTTKNHVYTVRTADGKCDSIRYETDLTVQWCFSANAPYMPEPACADDESMLVKFDIQQGAETVERYEVAFSDAAKAAGFADGEVEYKDGFLIVPMPANLTEVSNDYTFSVVVTDTLCDTLPTYKDIELRLSYPSSVLQQKWNDVIAIYNADYNGFGDDFDDFQWYKNGELMYGETNSYLYLGDGSTFNGNDQYHAVVRRTSDGERFSICPLQPQAQTRAQGMVYPTPADRGQRITIGDMPSEGGQLTCLNATGMTVFTQQMAAGENSFTAPDRAGVYVLALQTQHGLRQYKLIVK